MGWRWILVVAGLWLAANVQAEIFKWVDERGNIHFGDAPPEDARTETIMPNTDKLGVQLSNPASAQQWKQDALQSKPESKSTPATTAPTVATQNVRNNNADHQTLDWCDGVVGECFTSEQDYVCKLRYGTDCQSIYHWKVCLHQSCQSRDQ